MALISFGFVSACSKTSDLETEQSSTTASIDGNYVGACLNFDTDSDGTIDGLKVAFKIENGNGYGAFLYFDHNAACTGTPQIRRMSDGAVVTELEHTAANLRILPVTNVPANFYAIAGDDPGNIGQTSYPVFYKPDADHLYFLSEAITSNPGPAWSDWEAASVDVAGFAAAPTTYTPSTGGAQGGGDSSVLPLTKVTSF